MSQIESAERALKWLASLAGERVGKPTRCPYFGIDTKAKEEVHATLKVTPRYKRGLVQLLAWTGRLPLERNPWWILGEMQKWSGVDHLNEYLNSRCCVPHHNTAAPFEEGSLVHRTALASKVYGARPSLAPLG